MPPHPPHEPPLPPHLRPHDGPPHPPLSPHERQKKIDFQLLGKSVLLATVFCVLLGGVLLYFNVGLNVILPALAPVWVGGTTLWYSSHSKP